MKKKIDFKWFFKFQRKLTQKICNLYVCIRNSLGKLKYLESKEIFFYSIKTGL